MKRMAGIGIKGAVEEGLKNPTPRNLPLWLRFDLDIEGNARVRLVTLISNALSSHC
jgi:hypothetical protein